MTPIVRYRKKPITVDTILWDGTNAEAVQAFCGTITRTGMCAFQPGNGPQSALVWNSEERCWVDVPVQHVVARGALNELYPISPAALAATFERAEVEA